MWCKPYKSGALIIVKITPRASRNAILGIEKTWLRMALCAPPVEGKANEMAREFLAEYCHLSRSNVSLVSGKTSRLKSFYLATLSPENCRDLFTS
ncbi:MAG: DUF167 domain-containing protein [Kiritimatiellia bacterium]